MFTWIILTFGLNLGGRPKCKIQLSLAPSNTITSASCNALKEEIKELLVSCI